MVQIKAYSYLRKIKGKKRRKRIFVKAHTRKAPKPVIKKMFRLTLALIYPVNNRQYRSFKVQTWDITENDLRNIEPELKKELREKFIKELGDPDERNATEAMELESVPFNKNLINKVEFFDEFSSKTTRKGR